MKLEITKYEWMLVKGDPKIVISMVKQMDDDGAYIKFAKLKEICPELSEHPVTFKKLEPTPNPKKSSVVDPDECPF